MNTLICPFCNFPLTNATAAEGYLNPANTQYCNSCRAYVSTKNNEIIYADAFINEYELSIDFEMKIMEIRRDSIINPNTNKLIKKITFHNLEELQKVIQTYLIFS